ncbi:MAG: outer membrane lipoprotein-sorting protein [Gammaproteobacteria bacterium]|jgi:outer membrane lipoprotein-sorting protein|nr:outer membrane lipoprotein-sorting protein [Gammaproteobacteria bacterium]
MQRFIAVLTVCLVSPLALATTPEPRDLIIQAMNHWRGTTSYSEITMTIHRPDWQRSMSMVCWTRGDKTTLVRITEPKKDAGNGTLTKDNNMWTFSPKINRIIKVPSSMMNQSWMGSDFSNKDISKSTDIVDQYDHTLLETRQQDGHMVYLIQSVPHEDAAIVWGKEILVIRDDYVLLEQQFWDQDGILVKTMKAREIKMMGGRTVASIVRMSKQETAEEWTEMSVQKIQFNINIDDSLFTLSNLRNPRQ